jgi:hypothetical protein
MKKPSLREKSQEFLQRRREFWTQREATMIQTKD